MPAKTKPFPLASIKMMKKYLITILSVLYSSILIAQNNFCKFEFTENNDIKVNIYVKKYVTVTDSNWIYLEIEHKKDTLLSKYSPSIKFTFLQKNAYFNRTNNYKQTRIGINRYNKIPPEITIFNRSKHDITFSNSFNAILYNEKHENDTNLIKCVLEFDIFKYRDKKRKIKELNVDSLFFEFYWCKPTEMQVEELVDKFINNLYCQNNTEARYDDLNRLLFKIEIADAVSINQYIEILKNTTLAPRNKEHILTYLNENYYNDSLVVDFLKGDLNSDTTMYYFDETWSVSKILPNTMQEFVAYYRTNISDESLYYDKPLRWFCLKRCRFPEIEEYSNDISNIYIGYHSKFRYPDSVITSKDIRLWATYIDNLVMIGDSLNIGIIIPFLKDKRLMELNDEPFIDWFSGGCGWHVKPLRICDKALEAIYILKGRISSLNYEKYFLNEDGDLIWKSRIKFITIRKYKKVKEEIQSERDCHINQLLIEYNKNTER